VLVCDYTTATFKTPLNSHLPEARAQSWQVVVGTCDFYPRDAMLARVIAIATCLSVRLSVRLSVTCRYCVKTKKASGMISSSSGSPKTLVF